MGNLVSIVAVRGELSGVRNSGFSVQLPLISVN
jgi:hypothetical protein